MEDVGPGARLRDMLGGGSLRRMGLVGWLGWLGMWCGIVGAAGLFLGVPWAALEERAEREAREAVERQLVRRQCGDLPMVPPSRRVVEGIVREDRDVMEEVARLWRQYSDCRARALGSEPLPGGTSVMKTSETAKELAS